MPLTTVLLKSLKTALTRSAGWIVLVGLPGCLLAQALAPLPHGDLPSAGLPLLLSGEVQGSWTAEKISIQGRSFTPAAGARWVDVIPTANDNLILVERYTPEQARGAARVVYYGYNPTRGRLDTLRQLQLPFDETHPAARLTPNGDLLLLHAVEGWASHGDLTVQFAPDHEYERQGWVLDWAGAPLFLWGPRQSEYFIQAYPSPGGGGSAPALAVMALDYIAALSMSEQGQLAVGGYRWGEDAAMTPVLLVFNRFDWPPLEYPIQARKCTWLGDELVFVERAAAYRLTPGGPQRIVSWEGDLKPVVLGIADDGLLLLLSGGARPTPDGWTHTNVQLLSGPDLSHRQAIPGPVLVKLHHQYLQVGDDYYPVRAQP